MPSTRSYDQYCPVAVALDVLGERWTLLILRELLGGPRRYGDIRAALPGIATNLLAERLRELERIGLVEKSELPPPAARTVYSLTDHGWQATVPVIRSLAFFGLPQLVPPSSDEDVTAVTGFLAGIVVPFDPNKARLDEANYRAETNDRVFDFCVKNGQLGPAFGGEPKVKLSASAADLVRLRTADHQDTRRAIVERIQVHGDQRAVTRFRAAFSLTA